MKKKKNGQLEVDIKQELKFAQARYKQLFNNIDSGVAIYRALDDGSDFIVMDFNKAAEKIEKIARENVVGRRITDVFPGVRDFGLFDVLQRVWRTGEAEDFPIKMYKDKRIAGWRENYIYKLPSGEVVAVYKDVTKRKRDELALRMSEQCFKAIADYTYDWEIWVGPAGRVMWTNPAAHRITGYTIKEIKAMSEFPSLMVHEDHRDRIQRAFKSALRGTTGKNVEFKMYRKDGSVFWAEASWQPIFDDKGFSLGQRTSIRDITDRKHAETALKKNEEDKRMILDSIIEHVVYTDHDLTILWANQSACDSAELNRNEIIGRHCYEVWPERKSVCPNCPVQKAVETGLPQRIEKTTPDGRAWSIHATAARDNEGNIIGGVEITLEITELKKAIEIARLNLE